MKRWRASSVAAPGSRTSLKANLDGFFLRRLFQAVNRFPDILPVCDFCPVLQYLVPVFEQRHKTVDGQALRHKLRKAAASVASGLVAVKAEVNGLDVRTVIALAFFPQMAYNVMRLSNRSKGELLFLFKKRN